MFNAASFLPIGLEQLARDQGVLLKDRITPCNSYVDLPDPTQGPKHGHKELPACVVDFFGREINTASFAMYTFSISVGVQALLIISMSGAADHGKFRKTLLLAFAFIGAGTVMMFIFVVPKIYVVGSLLAIVSNTCFGASFVLLNSFLPLLVRYHPTLQNARAHNTETRPYSTAQPDLDPSESFDQDRSNSPDPSQMLLSHDQLDETTPPAPSKAATSDQLRLSTKISSYGIGIGYSAGLIVQAVCILIVVMTGQTTFSIRLALFVIGLWWLAFSIPAALWLRPRPGPPLPASLASKQTWIAYVIYAWASLWKTVKQARRLRDLVTFLCAWFLVSDSIATISGSVMLIWFSDALY